MTTDTSLPIKHAVLAYHNNCIDGFTSAYIAHKALTERGTPVIMVSMDYNSQSVDELKHTLEYNEVNHLYVLDFSLDVAVIKELTTEYPEMFFVILDHHKTAFEKYLPDFKVEEDSWKCFKLEGAWIHLYNAKSGASIAWDYFNTREERPWLVNYVEDYDLWRFTFEDATKYINLYLQGQPKTLNNWASLHNAMEYPRSRERFLSMGYDLHLKREAKIKQLMKNAFDITICGHTGKAVVLSGQGKLTSELGHKLAVFSGTFGAIIGFSESSRNDAVKWSLRADGDFDVSEIAKAFGGGGHKGAAGFYLSCEETVAQLEHSKATKTLTCNPAINVIPIEAAIPATAKEK